ncbi:siderophore-interacting protein [Phaeobacter inhibens]|uniref:siderophore-interacting protein n=1 Tax=Phaeobacter inhibens TaxID=221822 RepID=UPI000C9A9D14|nr:siderophore-interacting protein [Phaeobacter inhibens]AUQ55180.1 putative siderophore interacting protein [Phaeobacter inhibens]AUQ79196.1 putative siderophore interacting protein [Phaeobacter inhibens]AUR16355.1 putative siderophore interacting protein [Phaeobacter inhibens]
MTINPTFPLQTTATLSTLPFGTLRAPLVAMAQEHELPVIEDTDSAVTVEVPGFGHYHFTAQGNGLEIRVSAALPDRLHMLKDGFAEHLEELQPGLSQTLRWSDTATVGALPPNVHVTTVQSITPVGRSFLRVRVKAADLSSFQEDAIHFRLLLPAADCADPEWPRVAENGATVWPLGDKSLHRPVYTTRHIDQAAGEMTFDIFLHDGGRATNWVLGAKPGDTLRIAGPGGGGIPQTSQILIYADETALPAAARILETLPRDSRGAAVLLAAGGADCGYPIAAPEGISVTWLRHADQQSLCDLALTARAECPDHFLWFACEKSDVQRLRAAVKQDKPAPGQSYIAAYWSQS